MAEATDHPAPSPVPRAPVEHVPPPPAQEDIREASSPFSALALAGFGCAAFYAGVVTLAGLASLYARSRIALLVLAVLGPIVTVLGGRVARLGAGWGTPALAGLGLAVALALGGLVGLVGFSASSPVLLWPITFVLPVAA